MKTYVYMILTFCVFTTQAQINISHLPPVTSARESIETIEARKNALLDYYIQIPLAPPPAWPKGGFHEYANTVLSRMLRGVDLDQVNASILKPDFLPWLPGTDFALIGSLCRRKGDYDFVLQSLTKMAYIDLAAQNKLLSTAARDKLYHVLLSQTGYVHLNKVSIGGCLTVTDTENHILQTEVARYLANQLLFREAQTQNKPTAFYDNNLNGFNTWMLNHVAEFIKNDFSEFNSRPYEGYTLIALSNLYDYAQDKNVKLMAQMALDYLSAKFAVGSNGMRRLAPFRRQKAEVNVNRIIHYDIAVLRNIFLAGNYQFLKFENTNRNPDFYNLVDEPYHALMPAVSSYRIPELLLDTQINKQTEYFQKIRHTDIEMYHSSPNFLLTAGGRYRNMPDFGTGQNDARAQATTVLPTHGESEFKNLFYILGDKKAERRNNTCFAKNFACGFNVHVPENLDSSCVVKKGTWIFYDMQKCKSYGFYVAINKNKPTDDWDNINKDYSTLEVVEADGQFEKFMSTRLEQNPAKNFQQDQANTYVTYDKRVINFEFYLGEINKYLISSINGIKQEPDFQKWPRAEGDIMNSVVPGLIEIKNENLKKKLVLDARSPQKPIRFESSY